MPSPLTDSCNLLGKISFFSAQEKILVVPITRKTKSSAGHQRLPEAGNNVQGAQWRSPSWEAEGEQGEDTGPGLCGPWGRGRQIEELGKKDFPPKTLRSGLFSYILEMIQDHHTSLNGAGRFSAGALSPPLFLPPGLPACSPGCCSPQAPLPQASGLVCPQLLPWVTFH